MDQLQANLYKLLVELDDICRRNEVTYYIAAGTALGAIRGGGFLPWDDDIDLYITRDNWNRLVKVMETETPDNRVFVCNENTELYCNPVGRYVDKGTTVMMKSQLLCGKACGQLIEFFIMDPMPISEEGKWRHRRLMKVYTELLSPYFVVNRDILNTNVDFDYKLYNKYYIKSLFFGKKRVLAELLEMITSTPEEESDCYCMRRGMVTLMYGKELLGEPRMERFEDGMFPIPAKQEEVARIAYGDSWMYVPEGAGKVVHNLDKDLTTPFQEYVDLYMPLLDEKKLLRSYKKNKRIRAKALYRKNVFKRNFALARARIAAGRIQEKGYHIAELRDMLARKNFEKLKEQLDYYFSVQFNPDVKVDHVLVPVSDEYLYIAIMFYVLQGAYYKVNSIISARKETDAPLSGELQEADAMIQFCKALSVAMYDKKDVDLVDKILCEHSRYSEELIDGARARLWSICRKCSNQEDYQRLLSEAKREIERFGMDGELIRYEAYALYMLDEREEAKARYVTAVTHTRNGYVWREAGELFGIDVYEMVDGSEEEKENEAAVIEEDGNEEDGNVESGSEGDGNDD